MKISVYKKQMTQAYPIWLRSAGYVYLPSKGREKESFARRLGSEFYPRFHLYVDEEKNKEGKDIVILNLHLDQKKPGYQGYNRHNAEYDGEVVEREAMRLKGLLLPDFFV